MDGEVGERVDEMTSWFLFARNESPGSSCSHLTPLFSVVCVPSWGRERLAPVHNCRPLGSGSHFSPSWLLVPQL